MHGNLNKLGINRSMGMNAMFSYQFYYVLQIYFSPAYFGKHNYRTF